MVNQLDDVAFVDFFPASVTILFFVTFVKLTKKGCFDSRKIRVIRRQVIIFLSKM